MSVAFCLFCFPECLFPAVGQTSRSTYVSERLLIHSKPKLKGRAVTLDLYEERRERVTAAYGIESATSWSQA